MVIHEDIVTNLKRPCDMSTDRLGTIQIQIFQMPEQSGITSLRKLVMLGTSSASNHSWTAIIGKINDMSIIIFLVSNT